MNKRIKKKRLKNCGFFNHRKDLKWKLKHGYRFPWVSEQGPCPIPLCVPGDCIICRFCSDVFLDWNGPYAVVCRFGRHEGNCKSFMLDKDQPLFRPEDRKNIDAYIAKVRGYDKEPEIPVSMSIEKAEWPNINPEEVLNTISDAMGVPRDIVQNSWGHKKSFNPFEDFSDEEMKVVSSMGEKLDKSGFNVDNLSDAEKAVYNKLNSKLVEEKEKIEDETILQYLDKLYSEGET